MGSTDNWMTFSFADYHDPDWVHFGPLRVMVENHIQPHEGFSAHPHRDVVEHNYQMGLIPDRAGTDFACHERGFSPSERQGEVEVAGVILKSGEGAGIADTDALHSQFGAETEALLFDLNMEAPLFWK